MCIQNDDVGGRQSVCRQELPTVCMLKESHEVRAADTKLLGSDSAESRWCTALPCRHSPSIGKPDPRRRADRPPETIPANAAAIPRHDEQLQVGHPSREQRLSRRAGDTPGDTAYALLVADIEVKRAGKYEPWFVFETNGHGPVLFPQLA
jgi:hypothetical protein